MAKIILCPGNIVEATAGGRPTTPAIYTCDVTPIFIDYIEPADSTAIYAQLVAVNEFDTLQIAGIVSFCLFMFIVGFGAGMVVKYMRRL